MSSMGVISSRTCAQSASSSSARMAARPVCAPWPISDLAIITVTVLSAPTLTQPFNAACPLVCGSGSDGCRRWRGGITPQPMTSAPAVAAPPRSTVRRFTMGSFLVGALAAHRKSEGRFSTTGIAADFECFWPPALIYQALLATDCIAFRLPDTTRVTWLYAFAPGRRVRHPAYFPSRPRSPESIPSLDHPGPRKGPASEAV
ncbi:hypothetical protein D3C71_1183980 [compost metagenome]